MAHKLRVGILFGGRSAEHEVSLVSATSIIHALDKSKYETMLQVYYGKRGWDNRGIPTKSTLSKLGLSDVAQELGRQIQLAA